MTQKSASSRPFRVAVDAVGGDYAPQEVVKGAIEAAREDGATVFLVGPPEKVEPELKRHDLQGLSVHLVPSEDAVKEGEQPALALRRSPRASVLVATSLVKQGQADAVVSMGSTGALMASAAILLGHMEGIERPVLGGPFLGYAPTMVCLDMGSNVDCRPAQFVDFAAIGTAFVRAFLGVENPTVALLNLGVEEGKGNKQVKEAYDLLKKSGLNFVGNVEANEIALGGANVIVCDGFVGNVVLKVCEGLGVAAAKHLEKRLAGRLPAEEVKALAREVFGLSNVLEGAGGPILGVNGVVVVGHGRAKAPTVRGVIATARLMVEREVVEKTRQELARLRASSRP